MKTGIVGRFSIGHAAAIVVVLLTMSTAAAEVRTWTSADGKFKVEAQLLAEEDGNVRLRKTDGTEITVPLTKLSDADRRFAKGQTPRDPASLPAFKNPADKTTEATPLRPVKQLGTKTAPTNEALETVREIADKFYADLRTTGREAAAATLTAEAQRLIGEKKSALALLPTPDEGATAIKVGKPKIVGQKADVPVQLRLNGKSHKTVLQLRSEDDSWRVFALSVVLGKDEQAINFEMPLPGDEKQDPLAALVGRTMELEGVTLDGRRLNMADYKGKVVLVDFWATWCGPCRDEIPNILANWQKYHASGFEVIAISVDRDLDELRSFVASERPPWTVIADRHPLNRNSMAAKYGISGIPAFVLIGADGKVATVHCRGDRLGQALAKLVPAKN